MTGVNDLDHALELIAGCCESSHTKRAAYGVLRTALIEATNDVWGTFERRRDLRDASDHALAALRVFERAYLDLYVLHGVDALDRLAPTARSMFRAVDPVLKAVVQLQRHIGRVRTRLARAEKRPGRPPTRHLQETVKIKLVALGMSAGEANDLLRSVNLTKDYKTRKTARRN